jgi:hypothetical protein
VYTPAAGYSGQDSLRYQVCDDQLPALCAEAELRITVSGVNDAPLAFADSYSLSEDETLTVSAAAGLLANDSDPENDPLTALLESGPSKGTLTLNADGSFSYRPNANATGSDSFSYRASDGTLSSAPATVCSPVPKSAASLK